MLKKTISRTGAPLAAVLAVALVMVATAPQAVGTANSSRKRVTVIGYALSGPANDHGYYQDQTVEIKKLGKKDGIKILVAQNADPTTATVFEDLARQGAQVVI